MNRAIYIWAVSLIVWVSLCSWAQWHHTETVNAWNTRRGFSTNVWTNLQAVLITDVWEQNSTTNEIPDWTLSNVELPFRPEIGTVDGAQYWDYYPANVMEGTVPGTNGISSRTWTNYYWSKIALMDETGISTNWTHADTNISIVATSGDIEFTNSITRSYEVFNPTNFTSNYEAERNLDVYMALAERNAVLSTNPIQVESNWGYEPRGYVDLFHSLNLESLKVIAKAQVPSFIVPMADYDAWFSTTQGYDAWRETSHWEWNDSDDDGTDDTWQTSVPSDFPVWTRPLICHSNDLPYTENITTNTSEGYYDEFYEEWVYSTPGWKAGIYSGSDLDEYGYINNTTTVYYVTNYTTAYFDLSPAKNYFAVTNDYFLSSMTNSWTFEPWDFSTSGETNWIMDSAGLKTNYYYYGIARTNTNSVVTNATVELYNYTSNLVDSATITNDISTNVLGVVVDPNMDIGFALSDYDIDGLKDIINDLHILAIDDFYHAGEPGNYDWYENRERLATTLTEEFSETWTYDWDVVKATNEWLWANSPTGNTSEMWLAADDYADTNDAVFANDGGYTFEMPGAGTASTLDVDGAGDSKWWADSMNRETKLIYTNASPYIAEYKTYLKAIPKREFSAYVNDGTEILDIQMTGVTSNYSHYASETITNDTTHTTGWFGGPQTYTNFPNWVSAATTNDVQDSTYTMWNRTRGYDILEPMVIMDFAVTNGFDYVE